MRLGKLGERVKQLDFSPNLEYAKAIGRRTGIKFGRIRPSGQGLAFLASVQSKSIPLWYRWSFAVLCQGRACCRSFVRWQSTGDWKFPTVGDVTVVRFVDRKILDEGNIQEIGQELFDLVEKEGCKKLLLNFSTVDFLSSAALGKLITLDKKVQGRRRQAEAQQHSSGDLRGVPADPFV